MLTLLVNLLGLLVMFAIVWWFWLGKTTKNSTFVAQSVDITVANGIYDPAILQAQQGSHIQLRFTRLDASPCAERVVFPELGISAELPVKKPFTITLELAKAGEFEFTCAMGMYRGKLLVTPFERSL